MTHPLDAFERIYIINLAHRADRRAEMGRQLRRIGLSWRSDRVVRFDASRPVDAGGFPSIGVRGCFLSHLGVLQDAAASGLTRILVLEDDLNFSPTFMADSASTLSASAMAPYALVYGGHRVEGELPAGCGLVEVRPDMKIDTLHFVAIAGPAIQGLVQLLGEMLQRPLGHADGGPMHVDGAYNWFRALHPECKTAVAVPELGYQRASRTDIHSGRWFDRVPILRNVADVVRRRRDA